MKIINAPQIISLNEKYLKPTILFLATLVKFNRKILAIDFSEIREMERGDLMVFSAQIEKSILTHKNKIYRNGALPASKNIKKLINNFEDVLHVNKPINIQDINSAEKERLLNPEIIDSVVNNLKKIGIKNYFYPFNDFLTELIANAVEHGIDNKNINWWLTHEIDYVSKTAKYTFVDMGLGIISSHKKAGLSWRYFFLSDKQILLKAFSGELGSSTKQPNRGKGLPQLRNMIEKENISNLKIITNKVSLNFKDGSFVMKTNPNFVGTYYSWTVDQNNYNKWKNLQ